MGTEYLRYDVMVESALRGVVREALRQAADHGLPGNHHFYITFRTRHSGVDIPPYLREQYPSEMTIVLQYQFYALEVTEQAFGVTLSFNNVHERLVVPFSAITTFADPSVNFALQFQPLNAADAADAVDQIEAEVTERVAEAARPEEPPKKGEVVALDAFRKKH
ncbi:SspB family protein [Arenibaculum pallidiluteum]|uniref:SspB family protein n=1 Tax=Arenibaculum pallidiluteum TaxID=2812559 RepID=UPI001A97946E|nr:ClpXP protease specificity-enhancing factor SspB [Arenibaculum pallidiluteum]